MSPFPSSASAPFWSRMVRLSTLDATRKAIRLGKFALMSPVMTFTEGRWVARMMWMPMARAFWASMASGVSTSPCTVIIRSASSSTTITMSGSDRLRCTPRPAAGSGAVVLRLGADVGQGGLRSGRIPERLPLGHLPVEVGQVPGAVGVEQLVAPLHLVHRPLEQSWPPRGCWSPPCAAGGAARCTSTARPSSGPPSGAGAASGCTGR